MFNTSKLTQVSDADCQPSSELSGGDVRPHTWCRIRSRALQDVHAFATHSRAYRALADMWRGKLRSGHFSFVDKDLSTFIADAARHFIDVSRSNTKCANYDQDPYQCSIAKCDRVQCKHSGKEGKEGTCRKSRRGDALIEPKELITLAVMPPLIRQGVFNSLTLGLSTGEDDTVQE